MPALNLNLNIAQALRLGRNTLPFQDDALVWLGDVYQDVDELWKVRDRIGVRQDTVFLGGSVYFNGTNNYLQTYSMDLGQNFELNFKNHSFTNPDDYTVCERRVSSTTDPDFWIRKEGTRMRMSAVVDGSNNTLSVECGTRRIVEINMKVTNGGFIDLTVIDDERNEFTGSQTRTGTLATTYDRLYIGRRRYADYEYWQTTFCEFSIKKDDEYFRFWDLENSTVGSTTTTFIDKINGDGLTFGGTKTVDTVVGNIFFPSYRNLHGYNIGENRWYNSEDLPIDTGAVTAEPMDGFSGSVRLASGDSVNRTTRIAGNINFSFHIEMDDGSIPVNVDNSETNPVNDFVIYLAGTAPTFTPVIENVRGNIYRVSIGTVAADLNAVFGFRKPAGVSSKSFRATGIQITTTQVLQGYIKAVNTIYAGTYLPASISNIGFDYSGNELVESGKVRFDANLTGSNMLNITSSTYLQFNDLAGVTILESTGTATPTISDDRVNFTSGKVNYLKLSNGFETYFSEGEGVNVYDISGSGETAIISGVTTSIFSTDDNQYPYNLLGGFDLWQNDTTSDYLRVPFTNAGQPIKTNGDSISGYTWISVSKKTGNYMNKSENLILMPEEPSLFYRQRDFSNKDTWFTYWGVPYELDVDDMDSNYEDYGVYFNNISKYPLISDLAVYKTVKTGEDLQRVLKFMKAT